MYNELVVLIILIASRSECAEQGKPSTNFYEAIEAELVYRFREENGKWPRYQQEIHFNNENRKRVLGIVEYIYGYCEEN